MGKRGVASRPLRPLNALRSMRTLLADPDDTAQVFHIIRALTGSSFERLYQRVLAHPTGRIVLEERRDLLGEHALLAFSYAQTGNHGIGFIVVMAAIRRWREGRREVIPLVWRGYRRGSRAQSLVAADWEALLSRPLREVRHLLNVEAPPAYTPQFSAAAAAMR